METIKILNEIKEQIERSKDYGLCVEMHYNKSYYTRDCRAIAELEEPKVVYKNKITYSILDDKEIKNDWFYKYFSYGFWLFYVYLYYINY